MSPDSISQWEQVSLNSFSNNYPAFHTLSNWLLTRLWFSPASVAIAQMVGLATIFSLTLHEIELWGVPQRILTAIAAIFSLSPVNGMLVITLWKDIPFTCAMLALFAVLLRIIRTDGRWLQTATGMCALWCALLLMSLFRHNGAPIVVLLLITLSIVWRKRCLKQILRVGINWLLVFVIVTGPVYRLIGVAPMAKFFVLQNLLHQTGAMVHHGAIAAEADLAFLAGMQPLAIWSKQYNCYSLNPLIYNGQFKHQFLQDKAEALTGIWWRAVLEHPAILLRHQLCVTKMLWQIAEPEDNHGRLYITERGIVPNDLGLRTGSLWPAARNLIDHLVDRTSRADLAWALWRPALYFYGLLFCVVLATIRLKRRKLLVAGLPAILNTGIWLAVITTQDLRFQYPVYVIALIVPALLFASRRAREV